MSAEVCVLQTLSRNERNGYLKFCKFKHRSLYLHVITFSCSKVLLLQRLDIYVNIFFTKCLSLVSSSRPEVFLEKGVLKICSKFTGEHPCRSLISIKLLCNFIEITLRHGCSPVKLLHIFRTPFSKNNSG